MASVLLIGGAGFIGSHLARALHRRGYEIMVIDNLTYYTAPLDHVSASIIETRLSGLRQIAGVIRGDASQSIFVRRVLESYRPTHLVHLAGVPLLSFANAHLEDAYQSMVGSTMAVLQAAQGLTWLERLVYISSSTVYGDFQYAPVDEDHPLCPKDVYGGAKLAGEVLVQSFSRRFGLPVVVVRPSAVYGPTDVNQRVSQVLVQNALLGRPLVLNDPSTALDFTSVFDVADGLALAVSHPSAPGQVINVTRGEGRTLLEFTQILRRWIPGLRVEVQVADPLVPRRGALDITRASGLLGYRPRYSLEEGLAHYVRCMAEHQFPGIDVSRIPSVAPEEPLSADRLPLLQALKG